MEMKHTREQRNGPSGAELAQAVAGGIAVQIEELVLYGFPHAGRQVVADAVAEALQLWFTENPLPQAWQGGTEIDHLDAGAFSASAQAPPAEIGANIAEALCDNFNTPAPPNRHHE